MTHHKLLLDASHAGTPLGVLVSPDKQLDQTRNSSLLPQSAVVGWAKSQVANETNCGLNREKYKNNLYASFIQNYAAGLEVCKFSEPKSANDLDQWPVRWRVEKFDHHRQAIMKAHSILGHLSILVAGGQVAQGTDCWLCDVLSVTSP